MLIIQASHRTEGTTAEASKSLQGLVGAEIIHLANLRVEHFSYEGTTDDDFHDIIIKLIKHEEVVFATPIYWYTMSGKMKAFLDRISDLLKWDKDTGRQLRGLTMHVMSVSGSDDALEHFGYPFSMSADYLGMEFGEYVHVYPGHLERVREFASKIQLQL